MSFSRLKKEELVDAALFFDVYITEESTKPEIIAALEEKEISWSNYKKFMLKEDQSDDQQDASSEFNNMVLLKMDRQNPTFDILGRRFTKEQPFQLVSEDDAQDIIDATEDMGGGFRIASPAEAKKYFG